MTIRTRNTVDSSLKQLQSSASRKEIEVKLPQKCVSEDFTDPFVPGHGSRIDTLPKSNKDAQILYPVKRMQRKIFYIDVGPFPAENVKEHVEKIQKEIEKRKITEQPKEYDPLSMQADYYFPHPKGLFA